jgi:hypothetical protein
MSYIIYLLESNNYNPYYYGPYYKFNQSTQFIFNQNFQSELSFTANRINFEKIQNVETVDNL